MRYLNFFAISLICCATGMAATITSTLSFALNSPASQVEALPQFDPALGTVTDGSVTLSGVVQNLVQVSNTGPGLFDVSIQDFINLGTLQAHIPFPVGGKIPNNTPVDSFLLPPTPFSASTSVRFQLGEFTGTGAVPFTLSLPKPEITVLQGGTVTNIFSSYFAKGNIAVSYTYTPAAAVPEPGSISLSLAGIGLLGLIGRRRMSRCLGPDR